MVIANLFTHVWLVEPTKKSIDFSCPVWFGLFFYLFLIIPTLIRTIFLWLPSDAICVRSFYGCVANYVKKIKKIKNAQKLLLMEGWVTSLTMRPNNLQKI
jgi:hypothetical protein